MRRKYFHDVVEIPMSHLNAYEIKDMEQRYSANSDPYQVLRSRTIALVEELGCTEAEAEVMLLDNHIDD